MPRVIGVVTSPTGAVIRDILHRLTSRFPLHVLVWPVRVQGEGSGAEVAAAIRGFNEIAARAGADGGTGSIDVPDLLIVARGGGSLEDLWGFNDEAVVRAVAASTLPVISAIGHETDWTLVDHAADMRAPTPSAAAEMAVPVRLELTASLAALHARLHGAANRYMSERHNRLRTTSRVLPSIDQLLALPRRRLDEAERRLTQSLGHHVEKKRTRFDAHARRLTPQPIIRTLGVYRERLFERTRRGQRAMARLVEQRRSVLGQATRLLASVNYKNILARGFVLVMNEREQPIKQAAAVRSGVALTLRFMDGDVAATAGDATTAGGTVKAVPRNRSTPTAAQKNAGQGDLF